MTPAEWKWFEAALSVPYGQVRLQIGEHAVSYQVVQVKPMRMAIATYVDGHFKGIWCRASSPCPEQGFMRRVERRLHSPKDLKGLKTLLGAKRVAEMAARTQVWFDPHWPSPATLRRHLAATCADAVLVYPSMPGPAVSAQEKAAVLEGTP